MNFNLTKYLREKHPEILAAFEAEKKERKRKQQRERSAEIYRLAKKAKSEEQAKALE